MVLFLQKNGTIYAYSKTMTENQSKELSNTVWYDGEFSFFEGESKEGFLKNFKWDGAKPIVEYVESKPYPEPEPDKLDLILEEVRKSSEDIVTETEAAYEAALNEAYAEGVNSL